MGFGCRVYTQCLHYEVPVLGHISSHIFNHLYNYSFLLPITIIFCIFASQSLKIVLISKNEICKIIE